MTSPLASVAQLAAFLDRSIDPGDTAALQALDIASSTVRAYCGHTISETTNDAVTLDGTGTSIVLLPGTPITAVDSVTVDGDLVDTADYRWSSTGYVLRVDGSVFPETPRSVEVTYTHGWAEVPGAILGVVLSLAGRMLDGSAGIKQEALGSYSVTYANPSPTLTAAETMALDPFRVTT